MSSNHGYKKKIKKGCRINGQRGINVEYSLQNNNILR